MRIWPWSRFAALEARIEALESGTKWTEVPTRPAAVDMDPAAAIWSELLPDAPFVTTEEDEDEDWRPTGVYL
jgi:hypothetical protein